MIQFRRTALFLATLLLSQQIAYPILMQEEKFIIAVVDFRNTGGEKSLDYLEKSIPESIITEMANTGDLEIVERSLLDEALKEMSLGMTGIVDEQTAVEVGRAVGANAILLGSYVSIGETIRINARLIDVKTSKIIKANSVQGDVKTEMFELMDDLARSMVSQITGATDQIVQYQPIPVEREAQGEEPLVEPELSIKPLYKRPLFWIVVVGGVAGGLYLLQSSEEPMSTVNLTVDIP